MHKCKTRKKERAISIDRFVRRDQRSEIKEQRDGEIETEGYRTESIFLS